MSETTVTAPTRSLQQALRHVALPAHDEHQALFGQRFDWQQEGTHLRFVLSRQIPAGGWVHAVMGEQTLCVRVHPEQQHRIGERSWSDYEDDARLMAWTLVHDDLIDTLANVFAGPFTPISIVSSPHIASPELSGTVLEFHVMDDQDNTHWQGALAVNEKTCERLVEQATRSALPRAAAKWPQLPLPIALRCDGPDVDSNVLKNCASGDMIVLGDRSRLLERMVAVARDGRPLPVLCQTDDHGVRIILNKAAATTSDTATPQTDTSDKETLAMSQTPPSPEGETSLASQIPIRLAIQTAAVDISLAELEQMESGMVVPLDVPVAGTNVTILANGAPVGDGELVAAGDKLAVCIRRWRPDGF